jgi:DNA repair protein RadA/Sms
VQAREIRAQTIAIDPIQKLICDDVSGSAGSPGQLKECTSRLVEFAKKNDTSIWLVGHVTDAGDIAGPQALQHSVDVVLKLERGKKFDGNERILRPFGKNRFGAVNAAGYFELTSKGFVPVSFDGWNDKL